MGATSLDELGRKQTHTISISELFPLQELPPYIAGKEAVCGRFFTYYYIVDVISAVCKHFFGLFSNKRNGIYYDVDVITSK